MTTTQAPARKLTGTKIGVVTSDKRDKTRKVDVEYQEVHPKYGKRIKRHQSFHVHDEKNESNEGDRVEIASCRPLSKTKNWRLVRVVNRAPEKIDHASLNKDAAEVMPPNEMNPDANASAQDAETGE